MARRRLSAIVQERSRVLDLICQALPSLNSSQSGSFLTRSNTTIGIGLAGGRTTSRLSDRASFSATAASRIPGAADPLGPFTPEAEAALQEAKEARERYGK